MTSCYDVRMKYMFASLLCHRDVQVFALNWFCMRAHIDHGFDIPHLILSDGSLTEEDISELNQLPGVIVDAEPITRYPEAPKDILLGKLECLKRGFEHYDMDRMIVFDCDIFFLRNWDADLRTMLTNRAVVLRDWGSSIGPNVQQYRDLFGVQEDLSTPNCNTGVISIAKEDWPRIQASLDKHLANPFMIMEDQGIMVASFHGELTYAEGIKCIINNAESNQDLWSWTLSQRAAHLMGMRTRPEGLRSLVEASIGHIPSVIHLSQIKPHTQHSSWGLITYGQYRFTHPLQKIPSTSGGKFISDALYMHGGSSAHWKLAPRLRRFVSKVVCMDTGIPANVKPVIVNGHAFELGSEINVECYGRLDIQTQDGPGSHIALLSPALWPDKQTRPDLSRQTP